MKCKLCAYCINDGETLRCRNTERVGWRDEPQEDFLGVHMRCTTAIIYLCKDHKYFLRCEENTAYFLNY